MKLKENTIKKIVKANLKGESGRSIARTILGRESRESTVRYILNKVNNKHVNLVRGFDNSRILVISDIHAPYHHKDTLEFLRYVKEKYNPTRIICIGDELDKHSLSYHEHDPDLASAGDELKAGMKFIKELKKLFPVMDILESNHGSLVYRKAKTAGIPRHYLKSYNDVLGVGDDWQWHFDLTVELPNMQSVYFHHGKVGDGMKLSQTMGMNCVQGHFHERFAINYWGSPVGLFWSMQVGSLVDDSSLAMAYNNANIKRPVLGVGLIIDSQPVLEPMVLDYFGNWIKK